jgi:uncharacterized protein (TIRG00374 family)
MSQTVTTPKDKRKQSFIAWAPRLLGLILLVVLLTRLDLHQVYQTLRQANPFLMIVAVLVIIPLILVKTIRWQVILRSQDIRFALWPAFLAYFGSLFIGLLTPGRLGEFVKAIHVSRAGQVSAARAFSSVLADRLFDLYALLCVGGMALLTLTAGKTGFGVVLGAMALITVPITLFLNETTFGWLQRSGSKWCGPVAQRLFGSSGWLQEIREGLCQLTWSKLMMTIGLTALAYLIFFGQGYLLALALKLPVGFGPISYAIALGSLVTLLPISISGLGTREAAMIAYLSTVGIAAEAALSFSLLVFLIFYIGGGLIGAIAWWIKPVDIGQDRN